ncbi:MAG: pyridoxal phosphate-dependent aminotransferase [Deltaproteobacteria bacterium]|nr:pyridoxal phosphate-dependent aminotransferase [Deltaproteobacteria bacterium]
MTAFVSDRAAALSPSIIRDMGKHRGPKTLDLTLGQPSLPPEREVVAAAEARLEAEGHGYTENAGLLAVRAAVAAYHGLPGRSAAENAVLTVGSEQGLYLAFSTVLNPGDEVLIPDPGFPAYRGIVAMVGGVPVPYPVTAETGLVPRAEVLAPLITPRTKAVLLNDPSNPFGAIIPPDELDRLAELVDARGLIAISDEIYRELRYDGQRHESICTRTERSLLVGGLSKSCALTGHRLGYVLGGAEVMRRATLVNQLMVTCAPRLAQYMALEIFQRPERMQAHLPFYAAARARLEAVAAELPPQASLHLGGGAFYAVLDISAFGPAMALALELVAEADVLVVPGVAFGESGGWFWRMSYAAGAEIAGEGLARVAAFLGARPASV